LADVTLDRLRRDYLFIAAPHAWPTPISRFSHPRPTWQTIAVNGRPALRSASQRDNITHLTQTQ